MNFDDYSSPPPHLPFSANYFSKLVFGQAAELQYPAIAPPGAVTSQKFSTEEPTHTAATLVFPLDVIPSICDLLPTTSAMEGAYAEGMRSVLVEFQINDDEYCYCYHFMKIRYIALVCNHKKHVESARDLVLHLSSPDFSEITSAVAELKRTSILSTIRGLSTSDVPLWRLATLLDERWMDEDVFNALTEILYFKHQATTSSPHGPAVPSCLFLPTSFLADARRYYQSKPQQYTTEILDLRRRLLLSIVQSISITSVLDNHYTAYVYHVGSTIVDHGDSLHQPPADDILDIISWVFAGLGHPPVDTIGSGTISKQGGFNGGDGSCGVAALNFIECYADTALRQWQGADSHLFRDVALQNLIRYHDGAAQMENFPAVVQNAVAHIFPAQTAAAISSLPSGYIDFNMYLPLNLHPIYRFVSHETALQHQLQNALAPTANQTSTHLVPIALDRAMPTCPPNIVPLIGSLSSTLLSAPVKLEMLPKIPTPPVFFISPTRPAQKRRNGQSGSISPTQSRRQRRRQKSITTISSDSDISTSSIKRLWPTPLLPKMEVEMASYDMDLCSSPKDHKPPSRAMKLPAQLLRVPKREPVVIDLCSPEPKWRPAGGGPNLATAARPSMRGMRLVEPAPGIVCKGSVFESWEDAREAVYAREARLGHRWRISQGKVDKHGNRKKVTLRCNHYYHAVPVHSTEIDPADYRHGKTIKTECLAHVNVNRIANSSLYHITLTHWDHNHAREIPEGAPVRRDPTKVEKASISQLATSTTQTFTRGQIAAVLKSQVHGSADDILEPRQISNIINDARSKARAEVNSLGGDFAAIIASLEEKGWLRFLKLNEDQVVTGIWWQSPLQGELCRRYGDILINDNTYARNQNGYPLNIGIIIDGHGCSRNGWYALHAQEDVAHHDWVFGCHLQSAGFPPEGLVSDRHRSIIASARRILPLTPHFFCIHHLDANVEINVRRSLGSQWSEFTQMFWKTYRAVSPEEFDRLWLILITNFPSARQYLQDELYPCRSQWAWAYTSFQFTCGVRTNGRVEGENRVNKLIGGPKKSAMQLFNGLNDRTTGQGVQDMIRVRDASRRQHAGPIESVFPGPLRVLRMYVGPYALQRSFKEMELSMYYRTEVLQRPDGVRDWNEYAIQVNKEVGYDWGTGEEAHMVNRFDNDTSYIGTAWLLRLAQGRGLQVQHLLRITHLGHGTTHILAILPDNQYVCDCCMGMNIGIPCRHYFQALGVVTNFHFIIGVVRARWYQDRNLDISNVPPTAANESTSLHHEVSVATVSQANPTVIASIPSNPLQLQPQVSTAPVPTQTIAARTVFHEAQAAIRPLIAGIQTQEQLDNLLNSFHGIQSTQADEKRQEAIHDPPALNPKGRPRSQRMTGATEGRPRGGGASIPSEKVGHSGRKCGVCRQEGHTRSTCPLVPHA